MIKLLSVLLCAVLLFAAVPFAVSAESEIDSIVEFGCEVADIICLQSSGEDAESRNLSPDFYLLLENGIRIDVERRWNVALQQAEEIFVLDGEEYYVETVDSPYPLSYTYYMLDPGTYTYTAKLDLGEKVFTCEYTIIVHENFIKSIEIKPITVSVVDDLYAAPFGGENEEQTYLCDWTKYLDAVVTTVDGEEIPIDSSLSFEYDGTTYMFWQFSYVYYPDRYGIFFDELFCITPLEKPYEHDMYFFSTTEVYVTAMPRIENVELPEENYFEEDCHLCGYGDYDFETDEWTDYYKRYGENYLTVLLSDGSVREAYFGEISSAESGKTYQALWIDDDMCVIGCDNVQGPGNEWGAGENTVNYYIFGKTYTRTVNVIGIESVDITPVKYYECDTGYYDYRDELEFTVTLTNGDTLYSNDENNYYRTLVYGDRYIYYYIDDNIYENTAGKYKGTLEILGEEYEFDIEIAEFPVVSFKADPIKVIMTDDPGYYYAVYDEKTGTYVKGEEFRASDVHITAALKDGGTVEGEGGIELGSQWFGAIFGPRNVLETPITTGKYNMDCELEGLHADVEFEIVSSCYDDHVLYLLMLHGLAVEEGDQFEPGTLVYAGLALDSSVSERVGELFDLPSSEYGVMEFTAGKNGEAVEPNGKVNFTFDCSYPEVANGITVAKLEGDELVPVKGSFNKTTKLFSFSLESAGYYVLTVNEALGFMPGDVNGNNKISSTVSCWAASTPCWAWA